MTWLRAVRSPNLRAYVEQFIQCLNFEVLDKFVNVAERHLNYVNREWRPHCNIGSRPHEARGQSAAGDGDAARDDGDGSAQ